MARIGVDVVGSSPEPDEALRALFEHTPDLFVTELVGEPTDAVEWIRKAKERAPAVRVVVLSAHQDVRYIDAALAGGAAAYVIKTAHPDDVASAVRQAFDPSIVFAGARGAPQPVEPPPSDDVADLTRRELEILRLVADGKSNAQVARTLWVTEQTVKFHLSNIYRKLDVANRTEASRWAQRRGLLVEAD